ncbi:MAG: hypothetical protein ACREP6_13640, partial [Candidatus Binataceae bacterium]
MIRRAAGERVWEELYPRPIGEAEVALDRTEELEAKWRTQPGQLWRAGPHRIVCGDSRDRAVVGFLFGAEPRCRVRMVFADPPYGINYSEKNKFLNKSDRGNRVQRPIENDNLTPEQSGALFETALAAAIPLCEPGASCYATVPSGPSLVQFIQAFDKSGFRFRHTLVWIK